ncbi:General secretion pathway protein D [Bathymodiolus thermophilus thioautotrophic gill symbiont]|uniref:General secretion pathway protein D n=1 Tax=Bathymodiolus thermophilus thioautotrophic gill symbiont TaxID=2360 RepID=A0A3G3ILL8_9GAMM|nr:type II secretion system secretin GspD [Bathymodiolus thermophilus thioautotrophic gill symbiont]AYQ56474.1 General secretion pathway protein D [Bathymodiolus thermophilus thioautotrophic gill symbiont]CAB5502633.1 General secretion pathway protein D [Bathymodiolus thermophilus thioautotrophic gill symbiont]
MKQHIKIILLSTLLFTSSAQALVLNLKNTDIRTLINTVSQATGKNFIIDPRVKAKVNVVSNQNVDDAKLYQFFASILQVHGYVIIPGDDFDKILPKNATKNTSPTLLADDLIVSAVLAVKNVPAKELISILRPLVSQYGYLTAYHPSNSIVMTDTNASIKRIKDMIETLDRQVDEDYEIITLKHTSAQEVANIIKSLLAKKSGNTLVISVNTQTNQIIIGGSKSKRLKARFLIAELDKDNGEEGGTSVIYLKHANAKDILPILQSVVNSKSSGKNKTTATNIQADEATNAIIATAPPAIILKLKKIIGKLDIERAQVLIEVVIAEIHSSESNELGIGLLGFGSKIGVMATDFNQQVTALLGSISSGTPSLKAGANYVLGNFNKEGGNYTSGLGAIISALDSMGNADILSTPSIVTLDNEEAEIVVGNEVPFITNTQLSSSNSNPFQNYERKNVGLTLKVKPQINEGGGIKLVIEQEVSNVLPSASAVDVITSKRKIKTTVMVKNNRLLVLGGMIDNTIRNTQQKVPLLGDIPILGRLFRFNRSSREKRHLILFIRPTILSEDNVGNISKQKYNYITAKSLLDDTEGLFPDYSKTGNPQAKPKATETLIKIPVSKAPVKTNTSTTFFGSVASKSNEDDFYEDDFYASDDED